MTTPVFCRKDGKKLVYWEDDGNLWCPSVRRSWLPGISTHWQEHTDHFVGFDYNGPAARRRGDRAKFDEQTGERVR